jgi:hypothetical protein
MCAFVQITPPAKRWCLSGNYNYIISSDVE